MATAAGPLRLVFLTLEYKAGTFSGNGIYAQSQVRSLTRLGHRVFVISAAPEASPSTSKTSDEYALIEIPVPVWGRLDRKSGWREFSEGITPAICTQVVSFAPHWALVVDWSAIGTYKRLVNADCWGEGGVNKPPLAYLNYRIYAVTEYKRRDDEDREADQEFYRMAESSAVGMASAITALSTADARYLEVDLGDARRKEVVPKALLPPLREDIRQIALSKDKGGSNQGWEKGRLYFTCCVRLSEEKNAMLFAAVLEELAPWLETVGIQPLLCGGAAKAEEGSYAQAVKERVSKAAPGVVLKDGFLPPEGLAEVFSRTLLNFHPCVYDAYGMTIVEAAAFGVPSVVNKGTAGAVGAADLLRIRDGMAIGVNLERKPAQIAEAVKEALLDRRKLAEVGTAAAGKAMAWSEEANAKELVDILRSSPRLPPSRPGPEDAVL
ncbi:hypothetical protein KFL_003100130 [Klebsormidium nitens]|uniref:Glycosyl transferase family 1 domain-containing protein n=1 Tax=Klebsormidium nitens TaxID=105231 RepID=A0A1Y1IDK2_KLENI|nr:hypothetical protein KFL_003100130 [Klebsormidium nitens]|eukprot:GAQ86776.1 hypothetical protein KFL_003100130 [Klebsormidium nitens]